MDVAGGNGADQHEKTNQFNTLHIHRLLSARHGQNQKPLSGTKRSDGNPFKRIRDGIGGGSFTLLMNSFFDQRETQLSRCPSSSHCLHALQCRLL